MVKHIFEWIPNAERVVTLIYKNKTLKLIERENKVELLMWKRIEEDDEMVDFLRFFFYCSESVSVAGNNNNNKKWHLS